MPYQQVTLAQFQVMLSDKWESVPFWTDADSIQAINESLRIWNLLTGYWKKKAVITTIANQVWYPLSSTLLYGLRGEWRGLPVSYTSVFDMDYGRPNWESETTSSGNGVPTHPTHIIPKGLTLIGLWPADAIGDNSLLIDSVRSTPTLTLPGDYIDIGEEEFRALLGYSLHVASFKIGGTKWKSTMHYYTEFIKAAANRNERLKSSTMYRRAMGLDGGLIWRPFRMPNIAAPDLTGANQAQRG